MSGLRVLARWIGDQVYVILISLGWQPKEERDDKKPPDVS